MQRVLCVFVVVFGVWWFVLKPWAERWLVRREHRSRGAFSRGALIRRRLARPLTARWLFLEARRLAFAGAAWSVVVRDLNPKCDLAVGGLLMRLQAVHVGRPLNALELIADACRDALHANPEATLFDALSLASRRAPPVPIVRVL